jgi:hypothetical protein
VTVAVKNSAGVSPGKYVLPDLEGVSFPSSTCLTFHFSHGFDEKHTTFVGGNLTCHKSVPKYIGTGRYFIPCSEVLLFGVILGRTWRPTPEGNTYLRIPGENTKVAFLGNVHRREGALPTGTQPRSDGTVQRGGDADRPKPPRGTSRLVHVIYHERPNQGEQP